METPFRGHEAGNASLSPNAVLLATVALVVLTVLVPVGAMISGPLLLLLGVLARREARTRSLSTTASELTLAAGILVALVAVAIAFGATSLLPVSVRTDMPPPTVVTPSP